MWISIKILAHEDATPHEPVFLFGIFYRTIGQVFDASAHGRPGEWMSVSASMSIHECVD